MEHTHKEDGLSICMDYVLSLVNAGAAAAVCDDMCPRHHVRNMYVWQISVFDGWDTLEEESEQIEAAYCDPMQQNLPVRVSSSLSLSLSLSLSFLPKSINGVNEFLKILYGVEMAIYFYNIQVIIILTGASQTV
jgi:hypothetical protein